MADTGVLPEVEDEELLRRHYAPDELLSTPEFLEVRYDDQSDRPLPDTSELQDILTSRRLLVIGGTTAVKRTVALRTAFTFATAQEPVIPALELRPSFQAQDLILQLRQRTTPAVFVFPNLEPHRINGDLDRLYKQVREHGHWMILTTGRSKTEWHLSTEVAPCWHELEETDLYAPGALGRHLATQLDASEAPLPDGAPTRELGEDLGTPDVIDRFVELWRSRGEGTPLEELVRQAKDPDDSVNAWFHTQLTPREQLIALGLALLDGLEEQALFEAMERLMAGPWRNRDATLQFVDYGDLSRLMAYFAFEETADASSGIRRIVARGDETRLAILKAGWQTHRRLIIASLSELAELAREAIPSDDTSPGLFANETSREHMLTAVAQTLGELGRLSPADVEPALLTLVSDGRDDVHEVLASALMHWRPALDTQLFTMLLDWRTGTRAQRVLRRSSILGGLRLPAYDESPAGPGLTKLTDLFAADAAERVSQTLKNVAQPNLALLHRGSTVALGRAIVTIIGRAAEMDDEDQLRDDLLRLLVTWLRSRDSAIVARICRDTLPRLIMAHPVQIAGILPQLREAIGDAARLNEHLQWGISAGFGWAHARRPTRVRAILGQTFHLETEGRTDDPWIAQAALRALGFVQWTQVEAPGGYSLDDAMGFIKSTFEQDTRTAVRDAALLAIDGIVFNAFAKVEHHFDGVVAWLERSEWDSLRDRFTSQQAVERSRLGPGDFTFSVRVGGEPFTLAGWHELKRTPPTVVFDTVFRWVERGDEVLAAFAFDVVARIRETIDMPEATERRRLREIQQRALPEEGPKRPPVTRPSRRRLILPTFARMGVDRATRGNNNKLKGPVRGTVHRLLGLPRAQQASMMRRYEFRDSAKPVVSATREALRFARMAPLYVMLALLAFGMSFLVLVCLGIVAANNG